MWPMNCDFRAYEVCTNFCRGLLQRGRRTGVEQLEPLNLVIIHSHYAQSSLRAFVMYIVRKALSGFLTIQMTLKLCNV